MWKRVEAAVDDLRPLIQSVGIDAKVHDVLDRVVTLELFRTDHDARPDLQRLRDFITRELTAEVPEIASVSFTGDLTDAAATKGLKVTVVTPDEDSDTVVIKTDKPVAPAGTSTFDTVAEAGQWPVIAAVLGVQGVMSVMGRDKMLIVARAPDVPWSDLLPAVEAAMTTAPARTPTVDEDQIRVQVEHILEREVNPALASHGGFIELLDVRGTELFIHMGGGCQGCSQSAATLRQGVELQLRERVPQISKIFDTTDHAAGENPYFRA